MCTLAASPAAHGLFHQAILHSGACTGPWGPGSAAYGQAVAQDLMQQVGETSLEALRSLPATALSEWPRGYENDLEFPG